MESVLPAAFSFSFLPVAIGDVGFDSDDRFDSFALASVVELDGTKHVSVIGQGEGFHAMVAGSSNQGWDFVDPVQKAVVAVDVKVAELVGDFRQESSRCRFRCRDVVPGRSVVGPNWVLGKPRGDLMPYTVDVILAVERGNR